MPKTWLARADTVLIKKNKTNAKRRNRKVMGKMGNGTSALKQAKGTILISPSKKSWVWRNTSKFNLHDLQEKLTNISGQLKFITASILSARMLEGDKLDSYLSPKIKNIMPDPYSLKDMEQGIKRVVKAIKAKEKIVICGDYDVDGATSSAVLKIVLEGLGVQPLVFIPDRLKDGYGPNAEKILEKFDGQKGLLVTLDCGATAFDALKAIASFGIDTIVIDHHIGDEDLPVAHSIINPNRKDEPKSDLCNLAAVGVTFLFCVGLMRHVKNSVPEMIVSKVELLKLLDLVALGTICDVVPLHGLNRAYVNCGLKVLNSPKRRLGLQKILEAAGIENAGGKVNKKLGVYELGFVIGPRINAGGRVGDSTFGVQLLTTTSIFEATRIAGELEEFNIERKYLETKALKEALKEAELQAFSQMKENKQKYIVVANDNWHPGVIGIVAGRLKEKFNYPSFVITFFDENNKKSIIGKASARGINTCDVGTTIKKAVKEGILLSGGGHKMAGGFSIEKSKITQFKKYLNDALKDIDTTFALQIDAPLSLAAVTEELWETLESLQPFGANYPTPLFLFSNLFVVNSRVVGDGHISCVLSDGKKSLKAIAFKACGTAMEELLLNDNHKLIHVVGQITKTVWKDTASFQINITDLSSANPVK